MKNYCIKQEDLIGQLEGFPLEVVKAMDEFTSAVIWAIFVLISIGLLCFYFTLVEI